MRCGVKYFRFALSLVAVGVATGCFFFLSRPVFADEKLVIEVLERNDCAHCVAEKEFLADLAKTRGDVSVRYYDIDAEGKELFQAVTVREGLPKATPITLVGGVILQGFDAPETTGKRIEELLRAGRGKKQYTFAEYVSDETMRVGKTERIAGASCEDGTTCPFPETEPLRFRLPLVGTVVDVSAFSLPTLSVVLGFIDGFNPCAMWVLVTFLLVLSQAKSRKKLLQVAGLFIVAETLMYYLILNVWFAAWDFIGLDRIVTPIVGIVAFGGGLFFLYEWYKSLGTKMACQIVDAENRSKIVRKIKGFIEGEFTMLVAIGIIGLAFTVNVIEFACSIGIPQAFTKIIELNDLGFFATQGLMALYILFYMIDDLLVFGFALWGFERLQSTENYSKWSALVGGLLMLLLGYLLVFSPEVLSGLK